MLVNDEQASTTKLVICELELNFLSRSVLFYKVPVPVTGLEFNLLTVMIINAGTLVSRESIAEQVFNQQLQFCNKCINSHMANIRKKLALISPKTLIKTQRNKGYIFLTQ